MKNLNTMRINEEIKTLCQAKKSKPNYVSFITFKDLMKKLTGKDFDEEFEKFMNEQEEARDE